MRKIGYARVSTGSQDSAMQLEALRRDGVKVLFQDSSSGVGVRPQLQVAIASLCPGDVLTVWKLDRAARSLTDLLGILTRIKAAGASIRSLTEPIDTTTPLGEFTVQILGAVAQLERAMIRERSNAGLAHAYRSGVRLGRRPYQWTSEEIDVIWDLRFEAGFSYRAIAHRFGVNEMTIARLIAGTHQRGKLPVLSKYL